MSSSLGENSLPVGATAPEHVMLKRGVTTETRQVLGNVGNAVATLNQQLQMKKDHLMQVNELCYWSVRALGNNIAFDHPRNCARRRAK